MQLLGAQPFGNRVVEGSAVKRSVDFHSLVMVRSRPVLDVLGPEEGNSWQFYTALQHIHLNHVQNFSQARWHMMHMLAHKSEQCPGPNETRTTPHVDLHSGHPAGQR